MGGGGGSSLAGGNKKYNKSLQSPNGNQRTRAVRHIHGAHKKQVAEARKPSSWIISS